MQGLVKLRKVQIYIKFIYNNSYVFKLGGAIGAPLLFSDWLLLARQPRVRAEVSTPQQIHCIITE